MTATLRSGVVDESSSNVGRGRYGDGYGDGYGYGYGDGDGYGIDA